MDINVQRKKIQFIKQGQGQPLVFLHGWGGSINSLTPLASLFSKKYQVVTLDLPGFGQSDPPDPNWGVKEYGELLVSLFNKIGLKKVVLFGHSFGGSLAIYLAAKHPEHIDKIVLCAPSFRRQVKKSRNILKKLPQPLRILIYRIFFPQSDLWRFPKLEANFRKIVNDDLSPYLSKIETKTLILWGQLDKETPVKNAYLLKKELKNSQLKTFPNIGHNLPLTQPELVFEEVKKFQ